MYLNYVGIARGETTSHPPPQLANTNEGSLIARLHPDIVGFGLVEIAQGYCQVLKNPKSKKMSGWVKP